MFLTENGKQVFLPGVGEHGSFLFAIYKVRTKCNIRNADEQKYPSLISSIDVYVLLK